MVGRNDSIFEDIVSESIALNREREGLANTNIIKWLRQKVHSNIVYRKVGPLNVFAGLLSLSNTIKRNRGYSKLPVLVGLIRLISSLDEAVDHLQDRLEIVVIGIRN